MSIAKEILEKRWDQKPEGNGFMKGQEVRNQIQLFQECCGLKNRKKENKKEEGSGADGERRGIQIFIFNMREITLVCILILKIQNREKN